MRHFERHEVPFTRRINRAARWPARPRRRHGALGWHGRALCDSQVIIEEAGGHRGLHAERPKAAGLALTLFEMSSKRRLFTRLIHHRMRATLNEMAPFLRLTRRIAALRAAASYAALIRASASMRPCAGRLAFAQDDAPIQITHRRADWPIRRACDMKWALAENHRRARYSPGVAQGTDYHFWRGVRINRQFIADT